MKFKIKRILAVMLVFCMMMGMVPMTAYAIELEEYDVWVAGTQVTSANAADILGDGAASYNPTTNTLTVNKNISATGCDVIQASTENDFNVVIADGVILTSADDDGIYYYGDGVLTVTGNNIDITLLSSGIYEAMVTTVGGLIVGIIAMFAYNYLVSRVNDVANVLEAQTLSFMDLKN